MHSQLSSLGVIYLLLGIAQTAHSMEEMFSRLYDFFWVVTGMIHQRIGRFPQFRMDARVFAVLNMLIIAVLLGTVPSVLAHRPWAIILAWTAGIIETLNGIAHLSGALFFRRYVPGAATAPFLLVLGILLLGALSRPA